MVDPKFPPFLITSLAAQNSNPKIPDEFFSNHLQGKNELMKLKLTSDASDKTWEVKLNGRTLADGWDDFSAAHSLRDDDVLVFRHVDDMVFHVTPSGRSFSHSHPISSSSGDTEDDGQSEDDYSDSKQSRIRRETSSENYCRLSVTLPNLREDRVNIAKHFADSNGLNKRCCEIELMNSSGKSWVLSVRRNTLTGQVYIRGGWRSFCHANKLKPGFSYRFKLVNNETKPLLQLCLTSTPKGNCSKPHGKSNVWDKSSSHDSQDDDDIDDGSSEDDGDDDDDHDHDGDVSYSKKSRFQTESSSSGNICLLAATTSNLRLNRVMLSKAFGRKNGLNKRCCEIDLVNPSGESWTLDLTYQASNDHACIRGGWTNFCRANNLKTGSFYRYELVKNGTRPVLQLCSHIPEGNCSKSNGKGNVSESASVKRNKYLTVTFKPYMLHSRQLRLPAHFLEVNGIKEEGEITLVDKNGVKWPSCVVLNNRTFYMTKGWMSFCVANEIEPGDDFTLEFVRGEGTTPMLKFFSKDKVAQELVDGSEEEEEGREETENRVQKRARVSAEGGPSRHTRASNKSSVDQGNVQRKEATQHCSISDQVIKVKQSVVDTLTCVKQFRSDLGIQERNLKDSLLEIEALEEKIKEFSKFFNIN